LREAVADAKQRPGKQSAKPTRLAPCHATKPKALWPLAWISATRRAETICRFLPRRLTHSLPLISPFRQRMRCLSGGLAANRIPDGLMPRPSREAVAPFGERFHRSLPHTLPGVWFVLRTASQASSCIPALDVRSARPDGFACGKSTQAAPAATCCPALAPSTKPLGRGAEKHAEGMIPHPDGGRHRFSAEKCRSKISKCFSAAFMGLNQRILRLLGQSLAGPSIT
jgi:hypothetical protein